MSIELKQAAQDAAEAIDWLLKNIRLDAPQLSGKAMGNAEKCASALRTALSQQPASQTEREAFEAEMRCEETWGHRSLKKRPDGRYQNWQVDVMWDVWQARASLPAPQSVTPEPVGEIKWAANVPNSIMEAVFYDLMPPIGTKLYTHPAPSVPDAVVRDAERWRGVERTSCDVTLRLHNTRSGLRSTVIDAAISQQPATASPATRRNNV